MKSSSPQIPAKLILFLTTLTSLMTAFMGSSLNIALPIIGVDFNSSALMLSWLSTIYLLTAAAFLLPVGRLSDIYGRTKFFKLGLLLIRVIAVWNKSGRNYITVIKNNTPKEVSRPFIAPKTACKSAAVTGCGSDIEDDSCAHPPKPTMVKISSAMDRRIVFITTPPLR